MTPKQFVLKKEALGLRIDALRQLPEGNGPGQIPADVYLALCTVGRRDIRTETDLAEIDTMLEQACERILPPAAQ